MRNKRDERYQSSMAGCRPWDAVATVVSHKRWNPKEVGCPGKGTQEVTESYLVGGLEHEFSWLIYG